MNNLFEETQRQTILSPDRVYRYCLWREWAQGEGYCVFVGLNPSTADEIKPDPTIRRCVNFAKDWGCQALCMLNLFAFRATEPSEMIGVADPIGPENDAYLLKLVPDAKLVVAAWGAHGGHLKRNLAVLHLLKDVCRWKCLGFTADKHPRHPLYIPKNQQLEDFYDQIGAIK